MRFLRKDFLVIFVLGISGGIPLALILSTLKAFLSEQSFDITVIGFLSVVTLPYSFKFLFAPILDSLKLPLFYKIYNRRRSWIIFCQIILVFLIALLGISGQKSNLLLIFLSASLVGFFSACQDIVIDAYRIEAFEEKDQGLGASFYIFGYRIGLLISGALALFLAEKIRWDYVYFIMSLFMALCIMASLIADEKTHEIKEKTKGFLSWFKEYVILPFKDFAKKPKWYVILLFVIFFKLGDAFAGSLAVPFFLDLGFSKTEIATIVKTFGLFATLAGVFCGGILVKKLGTSQSLFIGVIIQAISNLSYAYLAKSGYNVDALYLVIFVENFSGGIGDAVFVAYLSMLCNIKFSATQYALLSSFAGISRSLFSSSAGLVVVGIGWYKFFIFSVFLSIPTLVFLLIIKKYMK